MEQLRFIHTADLHLDSPFKGLKQLPAPLLNRVKESTFTALQKMIDLAIKEKVDFVLISGDLYDGEDRSLRAQHLLKKELERLQEQNIYTYIIHGNHDHLNGNWATLEWPSNVHYFGEEVEVIPFMKNGKTVAHIYGFSYPKRAVFENMVAKYEKVSGEGFHIALLHGQIEGNEEHDPYAPFTLNQVLEKNYDYWALGHIHQQQILHKQPPVIYPGNIQGRHSKETGDKGCFIVSLNQYTTSYSFHSTADILWFDVRISITGLKTEQQLIDLCQETLEQYRQSDKGVFLKLTFEGSSGLHSFLSNEADLLDLLFSITHGEEEKHSFIWIVSTTVLTSDCWDRELLKKEEHLVGDIARLVDGGNNPEFVHDAVSELYKNYRAKRYLEELSEQDCEEIIKEAEALLFSELLKEKSE